MDNNFNRVIQMYSSVKRYSDVMRCSVIDSSHLLGKKYSVVIIEEVALGKFRGFNEFSRKANITPRSLSIHLKDLEKNRIISKISNGSRSEYALTEKGRDLHKVVASIKKWNVKWGKVPKECVATSCTECGLYRP